MAVQGAYKQLRKDKLKAKKERKDIPSECRVPKNSEKRQESLSENAES